MKKIMSMAAMAVDALIAAIGDVEFTDEVIAAITDAAQSTATRHGLVVTGWQNADGSEVTGQTVVKPDDKLTAVWDTVNPLVPETHSEDSVDNAKAVTYDAYVLDANGNAYGSVKVTVGKTNNKGLASVKAVVKPGFGRSMTFKATEAKGGKATISAEPSPSAAKHSYFRVFCSYIAPKTASSPLTSGTKFSILSSIIYCGRCAHKRRARRNTWQNTSIPKRT